jgi:hypothetical protein
MQPANAAREETFGKDAPLWPFLTRFGGPAEALEPVADAVGHGHATDQDVKPSSKRARGELSVTAGDFPALSQWFFSN